MAKKEYTKADKMYARAMDNDRVGMISNDYSEPCNMPQKEFIREYPKLAYHNDRVDDTIRGVDGQINSVVNTLSRNRDIFK